MSRHHTTIAKGFARFLVSGAGNTVVTYGVYLALLSVFSYWLSYAIAFAFGILLAYFLNRYFVFRVPGGWHGPLLVGLVYLVQFAAGLGLVTVWVQGLHLPEVLAPFFSVSLLLPLTFLVNRQIFRHDGSTEIIDKP